VSQPTSFQPQSYELVTYWRELLDDFSHNDGRSKSGSNVLLTYFSFFVCCRCNKICWFVLWSHVVTCFMFGSCIFADVLL